MKEEFNKGMENLRKKESNKNSRNKKFLKSNKKKKIQGKATPAD
jgi:hypothetical protein